MYFLYLHGSRFISLKIRLSQSLERSVRYGTKEGEAKWVSKGHNVLRTEETGMWFPRLVLRIRDRVVMKIGLRLLPR